MSAPNEGFAESVARFRSEVSAAVTRARRASAEARDQVAAFRRENDTLAARARDGGLRVGADELTDPGARERAAEWRRERGLPVDEFPPAHRLVAEREPEPEPEPEPVDDPLAENDPVVLERDDPEPPRPARPAPPVRRTDPEDDDGYFADQQILLEGG